jgi:hypothetical protein
LEPDRLTVLWHSNGRYAYEKIVTSSE